MRRPQNMSLCDYIEWVINNELEDEPNDLEKDCWIPRKSRGRVRGRATAYWEGKNLAMYQLTYMAWHVMEENPFSQKLHASHTCDNKECVNPLHIVPEDPSTNEKRKLERTGVDVYKKSQSEYQINLRKENKAIMPTGLTHKEKAQWLLDNKTWTDENGCMRWTGHQDEKGYGRHNITITTGIKKKVEVHRYIHCMIKGLPYGEDPNDEWNAKGKGFKVADHICNEPNCVNPEHIKLISRSENALRSNTKSRKITEEDARAIIEDYLSMDDWPYGSKATFAQKWAEKLGVSTDVAKNIVFRKNRWKPLLIEYGLL